LIRRESGANTRSGPRWCGRTRRLVGQRSTRVCQWRPAHCLMLWYPITPFHDRNKRTALVSLVVSARPKHACSPSRGRRAIRPRIDGCRSPDRVRVARLGSLQRGSGDVEDRGMDSGQAPDSAKPSSVTQLLLRSLLTSHQAGSPLYALSGRTLGWPGSGVAKAGQKFRRPVTFENKKGPVTGAFPVAGAGFEPATSGL
jgi:hypothetical protein